MKKISVIIFLVLAIMLLLCSCGKESNDPKESGKDSESLLTTDSEAVSDSAEPESPLEKLKKYTIIRADNASDSVKDSVNTLQGVIAEWLGVRLSVGTDFGEANGAEIIVGNTGRQGSLDASELVESKYDFAIRADGENIVIYGNSDVAVANGVNYFISNCVSDEGIRVSEEYISDIGSEIEVYGTVVATPNRYTRYVDNKGSTIYGAQHLQGMTMDDEGNVYFSFTGLIVKVNQAGEEIGVYKVSDEMISLSTHIGNLYWHDGRLYIGLGISKTSLSKHKKYIGVLDDSVFEDHGGYVQDNDKAPLLYGINIGELSLDRTFTDSDGNSVARFGGGGIDGITVGKLPGGGYILPAGYRVDEDITAADGTVYKAGTVLENEVEVADDKEYIIAVRTQGSYDVFRYDDDNQQIMVFDFDDITDENLLPLTYERITNDDATTIDIKFNIFVYCGYHIYGTQVICYDKTTGDYLLWTYGRSAENNEFPKDSLTVIDGSKKLYMGEVEIGQSVPSTAENYRIALEYAENYTDSGDADRDGDTDEMPQGWHATLKCVCELGDIEKHEAVAYGETGYEARICGINTSLQGDNGCISLGNGFYYIAAQSNDDNALREDGVTVQKAYGAQARLYYINTGSGEWKFVRIK